MVGQPGFGRKSDGPASGKLVKGLYNEYTHDRECPPGS